MRLDKRDIAEWVNHTVDALRPIIQYEIKKEVNQQLHEALSKIIPSNHNTSYGGIYESDTECTHSIGEALSQEQ